MSPFSSGRRAWQLLLALGASVVASASSPIPEDPPYKVRCDGPLGLEECANMCPLHKAQSWCHIACWDEFCCCPKDPVGYRFCRTDGHVWNASAGQYGCLRECCAEKMPCGRGCCPEGLSCGFNFTLHVDRFNLTRPFECCVDPLSEVEDQDKKMCCAWGVGTDCRHPGGNVPCCLKCTSLGAKSFAGMLFCDAPEPLYYCQRHGSCDAWEEEQRFIFSAVSAAVATSAVGIVTILCCCGRIARNLRAFLPHCQRVQGAHLDERRLGAELIEGGILVETMVVAGASWEAADTYAWVAPALPPPVQTAARPPLPLDGAGCGIEDVAQVQALAHRSIDAATLLGVYDTLGHEAADTPAWVAPALPSQLQTAAHQPSPLDTTGIDIEDVAQASGTAVRHSFGAPTLGASSSSSSAPGTGTPTCILSDDGMLELEVPPGAAEESVIRQIQIRAVVAGPLLQQVRAGLQGDACSAIYSLEPHGQVFKQAVVVRLRGTDSVCCAAGPATSCMGPRPYGTVMLKKHSIGTEWVKLDSFMDEEGRVTASMRSFCWLVRACCQPLVSIGEFVHNKRLNIWIALHTMKLTMEDLQKQKEIGYRWTCIEDGQWDGLLTNDKIHGHTLLVKLGAATVLTRRVYWVHSRGFEQFGVTVSEQEVPEGARHVVLVCDGKERFRRELVALQEQTVSSTASPRSPSPTQASASSASSSVAAAAAPGDAVAGQAGHLSLAGATSGSASIAAVGLAGQAGHLSPACASSTSASAAAASVAGQAGHCSLADASSTAASTAVAAVAGQAGHLGQLGTASASSSTAAAAVPGDTAVESESAGAQAKSSRLVAALIIGNSDYKESVTRRKPLHYAVLDAERMRQRMFELGCPRDDVSMYNDVEGLVLEAACVCFVDKVSKLLRQDEGVVDNLVVFFFFAGHAYQRCGQFYMAPVDRHDGVNIEAALLKPLNQLQAPRACGKLITIVCCDACRDLDGPTVATGPTLAEPQPEPLSEKVESDDRETWRKLTSLRGSQNDFLLLWACDPGRTAGENKKLQGGLLTTALLRHLETPRISVQEAFGRAAGDVRRASMHRQRPWSEGNALEPIFLPRQNVHGGGG